MPPRSVLALLALTHLAWLSLAFAQPMPVGTEFQVNTYTTGGQGVPAVAVDPAGNFVVVWAGVGGPGSSIRAQRYDSAGAALGSEFQVSSTTVAGLGGPSVATDAAGNFVVVWVSNGSLESDTDATSIQGRRYDSTGAPLGGQFQVNTYTTSFQEQPKVAATATGDFIVVWQSIGSVGTDTNASPSIAAQRYDGTGAPQGGEFQVNTYTTSNQYHPAVAADGLGNVIVVWASNGSAGTDTISYSVQAQRYDAAGLPLGGQFQVNTFTTSSEYQASVAADASGNFLVVWTGRGPQSDYSIIEAQRFDAQGAPVGGEFRVNSMIRRGELLPVVTQAGPVDYIAVWVTFDYQASSDTDVPAIQVQHLDGNGMQDGPEFLVNTYTTGYQMPAAVAGNAAGDIVVVWQSDGSAGSDTDSSSVQAQRYAIDATTTSSTSSTSTSSTSSSSTSSTSSSSSSSSVTSTSSTTSSTFPTILLPGRTSLVRDQALAQFVSRADVASGSFPLPAVDVVAEGATLRFFDTAATAGDDTYALPAGSRWRGLGNPAGSRGYRYRGAGSAVDPCRIVLLKERVVKATCQGAGVTLRPPFTGDVGIVLTLGTVERYCARFGGDESRNDATLTRRRNAPAPVSCP